MKKQEAYEFYHKLIQSLSETELKTLHVTYPNVLKPSSLSIALKAKIKLIYQVIVELETNPSKSLNSIHS